MTATYVIVRNTKEAIHYLSMYPEINFAIVIKVDHKTRASQIFMRSGCEEPTIPVPGEFGSLQLHRGRYFELTWYPDNKIDWNLRVVLEENEAGFINFLRSQ